MDPNEKPGEDSTSEQIINYYRNYSQSKNLPKYFSGTSLSYMPEIAPEERREVKRDDPLEFLEGDDPKNVSRASSAMSNKKLEWDNGADIGYKNALHKSASLPTLASNTDFVKDGDDKKGHLLIVNYSNSDDEEIPIEINIESATSEENGSSNKPSGDTIVISTDSNLEKKISQFANTLSYLKKQIGLPDAHSTPNAPEEVKKVSEERVSTEQTPFIRRQEKPRRKINNVLDEKVIEEPQKGKKLVKQPTKEEIVKPFGAKVVNLCITKPITVDCNPKNCSFRNKIVQTSFKRSSVAVQTDKIPENEKIVLKNKSINDPNQGVVFFEHSTEEKSRSSETQTDTDVIASNCDSFEYVKNTEDVKQNLPSSSSSEMNKYITKEREKNVSTSSKEVNKTSSEEVAIVSSSRKTESSSNKFDTEVSEELSKDVKSNTTKIDNLKRHQTTSDLIHLLSDDSSKDCPLGKLISANSTDALLEELHKNFNLLQRLMRSKKYDSHTKKRYIKKIIGKIMDSNCLEDSASTSSELFYPKKGTGESFSPPKQKISTSTESSDIKQRSNLQDNIPWYPAAQSKKTSPRKRIQTFSTQMPPKKVSSSREEISSPPEIIPVQKDYRKHGRFTLTNNELLINHDSMVPETYGTNSSNELKDNIGGDSDHIYHSSESSRKTGSYTNWREDKTDSEKLFEEKLYPSGHYVTMYAKKERQHQIKWINNEISHLCQLKNLLEKPSSSQESDSNKSNKAKKLTSVYAVSKKVGDQDIKRKYVIETELGSNRIGDIDFNLSGQTYNVLGLYSQTKDKKLVGDIEVVTDNSTTNIRVRTRCVICGRVACDCKPESCTKCRQTTCVCIDLSSLNCPECNKDVCQCESGKVVGSCGSSTCTCVNLPQKLCPKCGKLNYRENCEYCAKDVGKGARRKYTDRQPLQKITSSEIANFELEESNQRSARQFREAIAQTSSQKCLRNTCVQTSLSSKDSRAEITPEEYVLAPMSGLPNLELDEIYQRSTKQFTEKIAQTSAQRFSRNTCVQTCPNSKDTHTEVTPKEYVSTSTSDTLKLTKNLDENNQRSAKECRANIALASAQRFSRNTCVQTCPNSKDTHTEMTPRECVSAATSENFQSRSAKQFTEKIAQTSTDRYSRNTSNTKDTPTEMTPKEYVCASTLTNCIKKLKNTDVQTDVQGKFAEIRSVDTQTSDKSVSKSPETLTKITQPEDKLKMRRALSEGSMSDKIDNDDLYYQTSDSIGSIQSDSGEQKSSMSSGVSCKCCKRLISERLAQLSIKMTKGSFPLCHPCLKQNSTARTMPKDHVCGCFSAVKTNHLHQLQKTLNHLNHRYCSCNNPARFKDTNYCCHCEKKLRKTARTNQGIAYTLLLEPKEGVEEEHEKKSSRRYLQEIRMRVPENNYKKKVKNRENNNRKQEVDNESAKQSNATLQEYLCKNRPDFIDSADYRRKTVLNNKFEREKNSANARLKFVQERAYPIKKNRLFTEKEMKEITRKNYKKLPEVQNKRLNNKEQQMHQASRLIVDTFNKTIQKYVLKGKKDFPTDVNVVNLF